MYLLDPLLEPNFKKMLPGRLPQTTQLLLRFIVFFCVLSPGYAGKKIRFLGPLRGQTNQIPRPVTRATKMRGNMKSDLAVLTLPRGPNETCKSWYAWARQGVHITCVLT